MDNTSWNMMTDEERAEVERDFLDLDLDDLSPPPPPRGQRFERSAEPESSSRQEWTEPRAAARSSGARPSRSGRNPTCRSWAITWNNPGRHAGSESRALMLFRELPGATRLLAEWEVGESGTRHLQALAIFANSRRRSWLVTQLPGSSCRELETKLDVIRYEQYCKKDQTVVVDVDRRYSRDKKALVSAEEAAAEGSAYSQALAGDPAPLVARAGSKWVFHHLRKIREASAYGPQLERRTDRAVPFVMWLYGTSGSGKTYFVSSLVATLASSPGSSRLTFFLSNPDERGKTWWDGMSALVQTVVCDDLRPTTLSFGGFCQLISNLPVKVDAKNATVDFCASLVLITAPAPPWSFWPLTAATGDVDQVLRRVSWCVEFLGVPSPPSISSAGAVSSTFVTPPPDSVATDHFPTRRPCEQSATPAFDPAGAQWASVRERALLRAVIKSRAHVHWQTVVADPEVRDAISAVMEKCVDLV